MVGVSVWRVASSGATICYYTVPMKRSIPSFLAHTQPGFEAIAADEIREELEGAKVRRTGLVGDKNGIIQFDYAGDPGDLLELRTVEDVFVLITSIHDLGPTYAALRDLRDQVQRAPLDSAVNLARQLRPGRGGQGKLRYRVVARQVGRANYRRVDAQEAVEKGIAARPDRRWTKSEEGALEFWLTLWPGEALLALRLSDEKMRHRDYKLQHLPASLRPTAAAAMVWLTRPRPDDLFLDPMCGAGTILLERAHAGRYQMLLGGDASEEAVATALANIGTRYKPIEVRRWDARDLPLDAGSVTAAAVNLPFGRQIGSPEENRRLYPAFLREAERVLRPGARLVLLSGDVRALDDALQRARGLASRASYRVEVLGAPAKLVVAQRL
jgi:tRNA (guanine6-N2)-methyltransferase